MLTATTPSFGVSVSSTSKPHPIRSVQAPAITFGQDVSNLRNPLRLGHKVSTEYEGAFRTAADELPYPRLIKAIADYGWTLGIQPYDAQQLESLGYKKPKTFEYNPETKWAFYRPSHPEGGAFAKDDLACYLAKIINNGALTDLPRGRKLSDDPKVRAIVAPDVSPLKLAAEDLLHQAKKLAGKDVGFDPKGSDALERALAAFLSGQAERDLQKWTKLLQEGHEKTFGHENVPVTEEEKHKLDTNIAIYECAKALLEPYK